MALELGIFLPVTNNGWILSPAAPPAPPTFALNRAIAQEAENRGFHFLLAQSVWRGHGGVTDFWNTSLEGFTLMSALGAVTERLGLVASVQPMLYAPPVAAKMVATADDVSNGRFGINVVAGANLTEFVFFGGVVAGSPETVAEHVAGVEEAGLDGVLVIFTDWFGGLARFCDEVLASKPGLAAGPDVEWARPAPVSAAG